MKVDPEICNTCGCKTEGCKGNGPPIASISYPVCAITGDVMWHPYSHKEVTDYISRFNREVMFSSKSGDWDTPKDLYNWLDDQFHFTLDPCTTEDNPLGVSKFYTSKEDGLKQSWAGERVYVNPPYGRIYPHWVKKAYKEVTENGCELVVMLLPARTDTIIFHDYCIKGDIWFLKGRLHFSGHKNAAPFPSMIVIFKGG